LLAEGVIRGVAEQVVHSLLPYASLHSFDDGGHASVKFARHIDRKRIFIRQGHRGTTIHDMLKGRELLRPLHHRAARSRRNFEVGRQEPGATRDQPRSRDTPLPAQRLDALLRYPELLRCLGRRHCPVCHF
jgi:hypothetical protein